MPDQTANLALPLLAASQAQKHVTHNEALTDLDALVQISVLDRNLTAPPGGATEGDRYIPAGPATGAWTGQENTIAVARDGAWVFYTPREGWLAWVADEDTLIGWDGAAWTGAGGPNAALKTLGVNASADGTNRLSVTTPSVLFNSETDDINATLNKQTAGDDARFTFQTGFSTRALFGLLANDDFTLKVTPDGSVFHDAMVIDKDTGGVSFPNMCRFSVNLNYDHYAATSYVTTDLNNEDLDIGNVFASGTFTAPRTASYLLGYTLGWTQNGTNLPGDYYGRLLVNGIDELLPTANQGTTAAANSGKIILACTGLVPLTAGDTVQLQHKFSSTDGYASADITRFWGEMVA